VVHFALTPVIPVHTLECSVVLSPLIISHDISLFVAAANLQQPAPLFQPQPGNDPLLAFLGLGATEPAAPLFQQQPTDDLSTVTLGLFEPLGLVGGVTEEVEEVSPFGPFFVLGGGATQVEPVNPPGQGGQAVATNTGCAGSEASPNSSGGSFGTITGGSSSSVPVSSGDGSGSSATTSNTGSPIIDCNLPPGFVVIVPDPVVLPAPAPTPAPTPPAMDDYDHMGMPP
jgi:hypothetical protein